jgi:hypothetical protein
MSISSWYTPTIINQDFTDSPPYVTWQGDNGGLGFPMAITKDLIHIANSGGPGPMMTDIRNKTTMLTFTGFNITDVPDTITGIEVKLDIQRNGRIADEFVGLCYGEGLVSRTKVDYSQDLEGHLIHFNKNVYGGETDMWEAEITPADLQDSNFGVMLRLQSHPFTPHRCGCRIYGIALRYYYA